MSKFEVPNLDQLIEAWEKDAQIDTTNAGSEMIKIPVIHSKYNKFLSLHKLAAHRKEIQLAEIKKRKWMYYNGRLTQEELKDEGWEPFPFTLKADLSVYMDADEDISKVKAQITFHDECVSFCTYVMKELNNRTWQMKEWMAWERFERGGN
jgi:Recombination, repair and ssDNA binding protein UvsY